MDYLDPDKKRQHTQRLFIGYGLVALAIGFGTILMALFAFGYTFDRRSGSVIQNGLIFIDMSPVDADVYIDDELIGRGNQRLVLPSDSYEIEIREDGYRDWTKQVDLRGGSVERFSYPFLFPEEIAGATYRRFNELPDIFSASPDRRWMIVQEADEASAFVRYDLREQVNLPSFFSLPVGVMTAHNDDEVQVSVVEWSNDSEHFIMRHQFGDRMEYILVNHVEPSQSQNLTARFSDTAFTDISLIDKQHDEYHLFNRDTDTLLLAQLASDEVEDVREEVLTYRSHGQDALAYITTMIDDIDDIDALVEQKLEDAEAVADQAFLVMQDGDDTAVIAAFPLDDKDTYLMDFARFSGEWRVAVSYAPSERVYIYQNPINSVLSSNSAITPLHVFRTSSTPERISFSANARNIATQAGFEISVYDNERDAAHQYNLSEGDAANNGRLQWMDGHRLLLASDDLLRVSDFDGDNVQELVNCTSRENVLFDTSYEHFYCIVESGDDASQFVLRRHSLLFDED